MQRCECPDDSDHHEPGECQEPSYDRFRDRRTGRVLWLCWHCERFRHEKITPSLTEIERLIERLEQSTGVIFTRTRANLGLPAKK
jgi:hypothetical protein